MLRAALEGLRILVVEDDADARSFVCRLLSERGARVLEAGDVKRAMSILQRRGADILVSDIGMPLQDGYDLIRMVRQRHPELPAIALTAPWQQ